MDKNIQCSSAPAIFFMLRGCWHVMLERDLWTPMCFCSHYFADGLIPASWHLGIRQSGKVSSARISSTTMNKVSNLALFAVAPLNWRFLRPLPAPLRQTTTPTAPPACRRLRMLSSTPTPSLNDSALLRAKGYQRGDRVLLFDGVCVLCNAGVDFVLRHDEHHAFKFAALQSDVGRALLHKFDAPTDLSTVVLVDGGRAYVRSEAVLRIGMQLGWYFALPAQLALFAVPKAVRDYLYSNVIAKNRYDWFGKKDECRFVDESNRSRFLR